jgi:LmbE family N-acetylglucosaminyl deacetylase
MHQITTTDDIKQLGTILCVWAHPDDEAFCCAGIMAAAIQNGQQVACLTATKGEVGLQGPSHWSKENLGKVRAGELQEALHIIGCNDHRWMDYVDGECHAVDQNEAVAKVQKVINDVQPDTILTFSTDGWTGHTDHQAVSQWVKMAAGGSDIAVYHTALTPKHYEQYLQAVDTAINVFYKLHAPLLTAADSCDIVFTLPGEICEKKCAALKAHRSQTGRLFESFDHEFLCGAFGTEIFVKA